MRADRLVAVLLMLQRRGHVTSAQVAEELEISERTARRDLEALGMAGLPVYSKQGRNGGWELLGGAKTDLSGLNAEEVRALFMVAGPASATPEIAAALRKLIRALPESFRDRAELAQSSVIIDQKGWSGNQSPKRSPSHLDAVQRAVIESTTLRLTYLDRQRNPSTRLVRPLGLASKQGNWYVIAETDAGRRTFRVDRMIEAEPTGERFERPADFDINAEWKAVTDEVDKRRLPATVDLAADADIVRLLRYLFGDRLRVGPARPDGRVDVQVSGPDLAIIAGQLASVGSRVEVLDPPEVRRRLGELGRELATLYAEDALVPASR